MEQKENNFAASVLGEIFAVTENNGHKIDPEQAKQKVHARLSSPEFINQMTGIFFDAKRSALAQSK